MRPDDEGMTLDDGTLLALLDGELEAREAARVRAALEAEPELAARLAALEADAALVSESLLLLDAPPPAARSAEVLPFRRPDPARSAPARRRPHVGWARAASITLLIAAGAAAGLPGSPVRGWLRLGWDRLAGGPEPASVPTAAAPEAAAPALDAPAGIRIEPDLGRLRLVLRDVAGGTPVEVAFVASGSAGAFVTGEARFQAGEGRIDVTAPTGPVRLEVPATATELVLVVDGVTWLTRTGERVEVAGPVVERSEDGVRFVVGGGGSGAGGGSAASGTRSPSGV